MALICAMPVYVDGQLVGVAGSGGLIDNIRELVQSTTIGESGYAFLVNSTADNMNVIANANKNEDSEINRYQENLFQTDNEKLISVLEKIGQRQSGIDQITLDGKEAYLAYSPLDTVNWSMVTVIELDDSSIITPINTLQENINAITRQTNGDMNTKIMLIAALFFIIVFAVTILIIVLSNQFAKRLVKPIQILTQGAERISGGDLDLQIHVESNDETAMLGEAFNRMTENLKEYIQNLAGLRRKRSASVRS